MIQNIDKQKIEGERGEGERKKEIGMQRRRSNKIKKARGELQMIPYDKMIVRNCHE